MDGVIVVDKPAGMTSHDVVDEVRRRLGTKRVGHGGTLDPDATGVLVIGVGKATRFLSYAQASPKRYLATAMFGASTTTQDASGEIVERRDASHLGEDEVRAALDKFIGEIEQVPPMVSAVKVGGERLYKKAARGEEIKREPRHVTVFTLELSSFRQGPDPEADLEVACSGGTYVRTLIHDLGAALGCGAHMRVLRRTAAGGFAAAEAVALDAVEAGALRPLADVVRDLSQIEVDSDDAGAIGFGRALPDVGDVAEDQHVALLRQGDLLAVYRRRGAELIPVRVVPR